MIYDLRNDKLFGDNYCMIYLYIICRNVMKIFTLGAFINHVDIPRGGGYVPNVHTITT